MLGRAKPKSYGQLTRAELARSFAHLRAAAGYAGVGASSTGAAKVRSGWEALAPLIETARIEARRATARKAGRSRSRAGWMSRRWPLVAGALATTTAAAGAGTYAMRRRRDHGAGGAALHPPESASVAADEASGAGQGTAGEAVGRGKDLWGTARQTVSGAARNLTDAAKTVSDKARTAGLDDRRAGASLEQTVG